MPLDKVTGVISGPQVNWTMAPQNTMKFATFMAKRRLAQGGAEIVEGLFFPEVHDLGGS